LSERVRKVRTIEKWARICLTLAVVAIASGCNLQPQVEKMVADSNARLLASQIPAAQLPLRPGDPKDDDVAQRIEQFIAEHPEQKTLNASLRVRQAIVYVNRKEYNLAEAAFKEAARHELVSARDAALVAVHEDLIWWYETSEADNLSEAQVKRAERARQAIIAEAKKRAGSPDIRDFLAEAAAWIGLKQLAGLSSFAEQRVLVQQIVDEYSSIFDPDDLNWLCKPGPLTTNVAMAAVRRRARAEPILDATARYAQNPKLEPKPTFRDPIMQDLVVATAQLPRCDRRFPRKR
jgi:hypothetical protein